MMRVRNTKSKYIFFFTQILYTVRQKGYLKDFNAIFICDRVLKRYVHLAV